MAIVTAIESLIPFGRQNAITRGRLVKLLGIRDREVRVLIEDAGRRGICIVNLQDGCGYFRPLDDDAEYVARNYNAQKAKAMSCIASNYGRKKWLQERSKSNK